MKNHLSMDVNFLGPLDFSPQVFHSSHISVTLAVWSKGQNYRKDREPIIKKVSVLKWKRDWWLWGDFFQDTWLHCVNFKCCKTGCSNKGLWGKGLTRGKNQRAGKSFIKETSLLTLRKMLIVTQAGVWRSCMLHHICAPLLLAEKKKKKSYLLVAAKELGPRPNEVRKIPPLITVDAIAGPLYPVEQDDQTHGCNSVSLKHYSRNF